MCIFISQVFGNCRTKIKIVKILFFIMFSRLTNLLELNDWVARRQKIVNQWIKRR